MGARSDPVSYEGRPSQLTELFLDPVLRSADEGTAPETETALDIFARYTRRDATDDLSPAPNLNDPAYEPIVLAGTRLRSDDLAVIVAKDLRGLAALNPASLSHVHRVATFSRASGLSVREFYLLRDLCGVQSVSLPDRPADPHDTRAFLDARDVVATGGLAVGDLAYLLAHDLHARSESALLRQVGEIRSELAAVRAAHQLPNEDLEEALTERLAVVIAGEEDRTAAVDVVLARSARPADEQAAQIDAHFASFLPAGAERDRVRALLIGPAALDAANTAERSTTVLLPLLAYLFRLEAKQRLLQKLSEQLLLGISEIVALLDNVTASDPAQSALSVLISEEFLTGSEEIDAARNVTEIAVCERLDKYRAPDQWTGNCSRGPGVCGHAWPRRRLAEPDRAAACRSQPRHGRASPISCIHHDAEGESSVAAHSQTAPGSLGFPCRSDLQQRGRADCGAACRGQQLAAPGIMTLVVHYEYDVDDLRRTEWLIKLDSAFAILGRLGVSAVQARGWNTARLTLEQATQIKLAVKAKYGADEWFALAPSLRDPLRERQRDALLAHVVHAGVALDPAAGTGARARFKDAEDVYGHLLIDPQMCACMDTTRIRQAISSVQLFVQRILMEFEPGIAFRPGDARQWMWRKTYRVWEANRKVFLWPENWIYPALRKDKSAFFQEFEDGLSQCDLDNDSAESAFMSYLKKLDEVANLEVCSLYDAIEEGTEDASGNHVVHVFARTHSTPHRYFYRRWINQRSWSPWERVAADIEGDHLIPVVHNRTLLLFWPQVPRKGTGAGTERAIRAHDRRLDEADRGRSAQVPRNPTRLDAVSRRDVAGDTGIKRRFHERLRRRQYIAVCPDVDNRPLLRGGARVRRSNLSFDASIFRSARKCGPCKCWSTTMRVTASFLSMASKERPLRNCTANWGISGEITSRSAKCRTARTPACCSTEPPMPIRLSLRCLGKRRMVRPV